MPKWWVGRHRFDVWFLQNVPRNPNGRDAEKNGGIMPTIRLILCGAILAACSGTAVGQITLGLKGGLTTAAIARLGSAIAEQPSVNVAHFKSLYSFKGGSDGGWPLGTLLEVNGALYGTTDIGGHCSDCGTIFKVTPSGTETVLHRFTGGSDGYGPFAGLINLNGVLYGTTEGGGASGNGTVFTITPAGQKTVLYNFLGGSSDGGLPTGSLFRISGALYGTTVGYGAGDRGTVFKVTPAGKEGLLHSFAGSSDGYEPFAAGVVALDGVFYGTTKMGGPSTCGTVFKVTPSGVETVLYSFGRLQNCVDGARPTAGLVALNGALYGTTTAGGSGGGIVFKITPTGVESTVYAFTGKADGSQPFAGLLALNGTLYGATAYGGTYGHGTVFKITPTATRLESVLYSFTGGADGSEPDASLIAVHGTLYGTTFVGGTSNNGTVFSITP
jgi:uncharacterized repeat protein (TIGR03803 family)